jgi:hypothetical protein
MSTVAKGCSIEGCTGKHRAHGLCLKHYKAAHFQATYVPKQKPVCSECGVEHHGRKNVCSKCDEIAYRKSEQRKLSLAAHAKTLAFKLTQQRYLQTIPLKKRAWTNAYRSRVHQATPPWANQQAINTIYQTAQTESLRTGLRIEVDHVIPLRGRYVSGLHVENNLQLLTKPDNCRKGNRLP